MVATLGWSDVCAKRGYRNAEIAKETLDRLGKRWADGTILDPCYAKRAYVCPDCGDYHLTKKDAHRFNPTDVFPTKSLTAVPARRIL